MSKCIITAVLLLLATVLACAEQAEPLSALAKMPVKEITIFKDGHVFVLHEGKMPTNAEGNVVLDYLPQPVIGTFWPYAANENLKLIGVQAGQRKVAVERTALTIHELLEGNIGADVVITETDGKRYSATIQSLFSAESADLEAIHQGSYEGVPSGLNNRDNLVMLKTDDGFRISRTDRIQDITFKTLPSHKHVDEGMRNLLTLKLDWGGRPAEKTADVGMIYLQKGIRWIPSYKVNLDGHGNASISLQSTLLNELADLNDVTANLVVGVPTFAFKDTIDPMSLQQIAAQLSPYFNQSSQTAYGFSNAIMSQQMRGGEYRRPDNGNPPPVDLGPDLIGTGKSEDLYVFTLKHITMRKGERMVVPIATFALKYQDIYTVDLLFEPSREMMRNINTPQQAEMARLFNAPKAMHTVRLVNNNAAPLTTAPALILTNNRLLAQGMMTYTAPGSSCDLPLTAAVDIQIKRKDVETKRTPNAVTFNGYQYSQVDLKGTITLTNLRAQPVTLEVTRGVLGNVTDADNNGVIQKIGAIDDDQTVLPSWVNNYSGAEWWDHLNGIANIKWNITIPPGKSIDLSYNWYYYWR